MDITKCILRIYPGWKGVVWENDYSKIQPHELETRPIPSLAELEAVWSQIEAEQIAAEATEEAIAQAKQQALSDTFPDWTKVKQALDNAFPDAKQNAFMTKLMKYIYIKEKNSVD